jgi:hypothetical protein
MGTTPATSELSIGFVLKPTKSMLIALAAALELELLTFNVTFSECVREPLVPATVRVELPVGVVALVDTDSVELVPGATDVGLKRSCDSCGQAFAEVHHTGKPIQSSNAS